MNEGRELLIRILDEKLKSIQEFNKDDVIVNGINLVNLLKSIEKNEDAFAQVTDDVIDYVIANSNIKNPSIFKNNSIRLRDLLIGKRDYKLNVELNNDYKNTIKLFIKHLNKILDNISPGVVNLDELNTSILKLKQEILNYEIINEFDLIEDLLEEYNKTNFDSNMIIVMKYVNEHNINLLKVHKKNAPLFDIKFIHRPKLDERIINILDKMEINPKELPNYLINELKKCDVEDVCNTYEIIKQNKAENGGILHLIKKDNTLARLVILLYATETSIKSVLNSIQDSKKVIDINILKVLINNDLTCFLSKNNDYFKPKYEDFIKNITMLKELNINYKSLINKTPIFMISDSKVLEVTLKYLEENGADRKLIINRCYKTLATNPSLLIDNVEILNNYNIDLKDYFGSENKNYGLLKTTNLEQRIRYVLEHSKKLNASDLNYELLTRYIIGKVIKESQDNQEVSND
jgi:hypothetical protein